MPLIHYDFRITLSDEQERVIGQIRRSLRRRAGEIIVGGLAGTGKTFLAAQLSRALKIPPQAIIYCSYTGKACQVLRTKLREAYLGDVEVRTCHSVFYFYHEVHCDRCPRSRLNVADDVRCHNIGCPDCQPQWEERLELDESLQGRRLIICDEASMIPEDMYYAMRRHGIPIIWIGDHGQLPPVNSDFDLMREPDIALESIHRQLADSPILQLAHQARNNGKVPFGEFGPGVLKRERDGTLEVNFEAGDLLLCGRNVTRVQLNKTIRAAKGYPDNKPVIGDRLICLRNNRGRGVVNGMLGRIEAIHNAELWKYGATIALANGETYEGLIAKEQFNQEKTQSDLRNMDLWDYGYALTVHKAQGSEANRVVLIEEWLKDTDHRRWLYTGITRAKRELEIIPWYYSR